MTTATVVHPDASVPDNWTSVVPVVNAFAQNAFFARVTNNLIIDNGFCHFANQVQLACSNPASRRLPLLELHGWGGPTRARDAVSR
jgi:hypothetical protein